MHTDWLINNGLTFTRAGHTYYVSWIGIVRVVACALIVPGVLLCTLTRVRRSTRLS